MYFITKKWDKILTFESQSIQIPRTFLWLFSQTFGLAYSPLNSAKLTCSSEVTLLLTQKTSYTANVVYSQFMSIVISCSLYANITSRKPLQKCVLQRRQKIANIAISLITTILYPKHPSSVERFSEKFDQKALTYLIFFVGTH